MHRSKITDIMLDDSEPVMEIGEFMREFSDFCGYYGYDDQSRLEVLAEIEDVLVLAAVTGPTPYHLEYPATGLSGEISEERKLQLSYAGWPLRVIRARRLYKQAFCLREGELKMTGALLSRGIKHFNERAAVLPDRIERIQPASGRREPALAH